jgi:hypothetical protein
VPIVHEHFLAIVSHTVIRATTNLNQQFLHVELSFSESISLKKVIMLRTSISIFLLAIAVPALYPASQANSSNNHASENATGAKVLTAPEAAKFLPAAVFFRGQSASIQARNSGGVRFSKDALLLVSLVDTSGYSSAVQEKYQAYLITESPINIEGHRLAPGAYGCGFVGADTFIVMDIGAHDLFTAHFNEDAGLRRPTPLQVLASPTGAGYRLYVGRKFVNFVEAAQ